MFRCLSRRFAAGFCCLLLVGLSSAPVLAEPTVEVLVGPKEDDPGEPKVGKLDLPFGVDFDARGRMIIVEYGGARVLRLEADGSLTKLAGGKSGYSGDGGPATEAAFNKMHNVAVGAQGQLFLSDTSNHAIRVINAAGKVTTLGGNGKKGFAGDGGPVQKARFSQAYCVSLNAKRDKLYLTDLGNRRIRAIDLEAMTISTVAGNGQKGAVSEGKQATESPLVDPRAAVLDPAGNLYIVSRGGHALRVVRPDGIIHTVAGTGKKGFKDGPAMEAKLNGPKHLACDEAGNVYLADDNNHVIRKYDPKAKTMTTVLGQGKFKLNRPHGVCVYKGYLYVVDSWNHRVVRMKLFIS